MYGIISVRLKFKRAFYFQFKNLFKKIVIVFQIMAGTPLSPSMEVPPPMTNSSLEIFTAPLPWDVSSRL